MNYYYLVFIILLIVSGVFFSNVVNKIAGFATSSLGIVALFAYLYYLYYQNPIQYVNEWPSPSYLQTIGLQCPTSTWRVEAMSRSGKDPTVTCVYSGPDDIKLQNCTDTGSQDKKTFSLATVTYPPVMSNDRKQWLENCKYVRKQDGQAITPPWVEYDLT